MPILAYLSNLGMGGSEAVPPPPQVVADVIRNFSLREWRKWHKPEDEKRLRELGITPRVAEVISQVAERQVSDLHLDEQQRLEEFHRELQLRGIEFKSRYLEVLNTQRELLIDAEIKILLDAQADRDAQDMLLLLAATL